MESADAKMGCERFDEQAQRLTNSVKSPPHPPEASTLCTPPETSCERVRPSDLPACQASAPNPPAPALPVCGCGSVRIARSAPSSES
jgi:hypothetical protein